MRKKRKYTRRVAPEAPQTALVGGSSPIEAQSSGKLGDCPHCFDKYRVRTGGRDCEHIRNLLEVTEADIAMLPPSLKLQLEGETKRRAFANRFRKGLFPDNLKERTEAMVRRFRGW